MPPCQENPWLCYTWPSLKTSPITFRLEAIAAGYCNGFSHFTTPWRIVKHLGFTILFLHSADKWIIAVWKTIQRPLNCITLWEQAVQCWLPFLAIYSEENVVLTTLQFENIPRCEIVQRFPQFCSSSSETVRNSKNLLPRLQLSGQELWEWACVWMSDAEFVSVTRQKCVFSS